MRLSLSKRLLLPVIAAGSASTPLAQAQLTSGATLNFDANLDHSANNRWESTVTHSGHDAALTDFEFLNLSSWPTYAPVNRTPETFSASNVAGIGRAYSLPLSPDTLIAFGKDGSRNFDAAGAFGGIASGTNYTNYDASFEIWLKPDNLTQTANILDLGGSGTGTSLFLQGNQLRLAVRDGAAADRRVVLTHDFSAGDVGNFQQVAFTINVDPLSGANSVSLYVNGALSSTATASGIISDWAGGNLGLLGTYTTLPGNNHADPNVTAAQLQPSFAGDLGVIRFYGNRLLTATEVLNNYNALNAADVYFDDSAASGKWMNGANWDTDLAPAGTQNATINGGLTATLDGGAAVSAANLTVGSNSSGGPNTPGSGTLIINDAATKLLLSGNLLLGSGSEAQRGTVTQNNGEVRVAGDLLYGSSGSSDAAIAAYTINGGSLHVQGDVNLTGAAERGHLYINGGSVNIEGDITLQSFRLGETGNQNVNFTLKPGQTLTNTGTLYIARGNSATGLATLQLNDTTSQLTVQNGIRIGVAGSKQGYLRIEQGAVDITAGGLRIAGEQTTQTATRGNVFLGTTGGSLTDASVIVRADNTEVGRGGTGSFTQYSGTFTQAGANFVVGQGDRSSGVVLIEDGQFNVANQLRIGNEGSGRFVQNGGEVNVTKILDLGNNAVSSSKGVYELNGGTLNAADKIRVGNGSAGDGSNPGGHFVVNGGTLNGVDVQIGQKAGSTGVLDYYGGTISLSGQFALANGTDAVSGSEVTRAELNFHNNTSFVSQNNLRLANDNAFSGAKFATVNLNDTSTFDLNGYQFGHGRGAALGSATVTLNLNDSSRFDVGVSGSEFSWGGLGTFTVNINDSAEFNARGRNYYQPEGAGNQAVYNIAGGALINTARIDADVNLSGGTLAISQDGVRRSTNLTQNGGHTFRQTGGTLAYHLFGNDGKLDHNSSLLSILNAGSAGRSDLLTANVVNLESGTIEVSLAGAFTTDQLAAGDYWDLLDWVTSANIDTSALTLALPDVSATGFTWDTRFFASDGILFLAPEPSKALLAILSLSTAIIGRRRARA